MGLEKGNRPKEHRHVVASVMCTDRSWHAHDHDARTVRDDQLSLATTLASVHVEVASHVGRTGHVGGITFALQLIIKIDKKISTCTINICVRILLASYGHA